MDQYAKQALSEYNSEECTPHPGGVGGRPFWNTHSSQFIFAPTLQFPRTASGHGYIFTAEDKNGDLHSFHSETSITSLAPIWGELPTGFFRLRAEALNHAGQKMGIVNERVFFKGAPFPGRDALPPPAKSYRQCAKDAFRYVFEDSMVQHWLIHGTPDPEYAHNAYPSKMISAIISAMVYYAKAEPSRADDALLLARRAADYLLSITPTGDDPLAGLPPTYSFLGMNAEAVNRVAPAAEGCLGTTMMIYPAAAGSGFLTLYEATGEEKYLEAALRIAEYLKETVLPCGSWHLLFDCKTGKPLTDNICVDFVFVKFFRKLFEITKDSAWHELETAHYKYISEVCLKTYNWEGQFEDVKVSGCYQNLTHFAANEMISYIANHLAEDEGMVSEAVDLMRYVEDQFVVWGEFAKWDPNRDYPPYHGPAGLEQYFCYLPIDSSTATVLGAFAEMYLLRGDRLYLEKAMALADTVTRMQDPESGMIPTFFIGENCEEGRRNFWINCQIHTAFILMRLADLVEAEGID